MVAFCVGPVDLFHLNSLTNWAGQGDWDCPSGLACAFVVPYSTKSKAILRTMSHQAHSKRIARARYASATSLDVKLQQ